MFPSDPAIFFFGLAVLLFGAFAQSFLTWLLIKLIFRIFQIKTDLSFGGFFFGVFLAGLTLSVFFFIVMLGVGSLIGGFAHPDLMMGISLPTMWGFLTAFALRNSMQKNGQTLGLMKGGGIFLLAFLIFAILLGIVGFGLIPMVVKFN